MRFNTIIYCIRQGLANIRRNRMFSIASMVTIAACVFLLGVFYSLIVNVRAIAQNAEETIGITVFFDEELEEKEILEIGNEIKARNEVSYVLYISPEEAWATFKQKYFEGSEELAAGFDEDNPLAHSASYEIHLKDVAQQAEFVEYLKGVEGVRKVNYSELAAGGLAGMNRLIAYISAVIILILVVVSLFLISNTITLAYTVRKEEIELTKWIGATDSFVRAPFIVEGLAIGAVGAAVPLVVLFFLYRLAVNAISGSFSILEDALVFVPASNVFSLLVPIALVMGIGIGFVGSSLTISKHLKV